MVPPIEAALPWLIPSLNSGILEPSSLVGYLSTGVTVAIDPFNVCGPLTSDDSIAVPSEVSKRTACC